MRILRSRTVKEAVVEMKSEKINKRKSRKTVAKKEVDLIPEKNVSQKENSVIDSYVEFEEKVNDRNSFKKSETNHFLNDTNISNDNIMNQVQANILDSSNYNTPNGNNTRKRWSKFSRYSTDAKIVLESISRSHERVENNVKRSSRSEKDILDETFEVRSTKKRKTEISSTKKDKNDTFEISSSKKDKNDTFEMSSSKKDKNDTFEMSSSKKEKNDVFEISSIKKDKNVTFDMSSTKTNKNELLSARKYKNRPLEICSEKKYTRTAVFDTSSAKKMHNTQELKNSSSVKSSRTKLPNFALIHQKAFEKMESLVDYSERKKTRAAEMIKSNKVARSMKFDDVKINASKTPVKQMTNSSRIPSARTLHTTLNKNIKKSNPEMSLTSKTLNKSLKEKKDSLKDLTKQKNIATVTNVKTTNILNRNNKFPKKEITFLSKVQNKSLKEQKENLSTVKKSCIPIAAKTNKIVKDEVKKPSIFARTEFIAVANKRRVQEDKTETKRNAIKNVRTNRRFELLMNMRNNA